MYGNNIIPGTAIRSDQMVDALLTNTTSLGVTNRAAVGNMYAGGQLGTGIQFTKLDAASAVVFNPAMLVVLHTPAMWDSQPEVQAMLKSLVETHSKSVTGLAFSYNVETADYPAGNDGQMLKVPTRTIRTAVSPSMSFNEVTGGLVWNFFRRWMFDMQHPDTNASNLAAEMGIDQIPPWVMTTYCMSMIAIQFDPTMLPDRIIDAAFYTNMFPTDIGELPIQRVIGESTIQERTVQFTGIVQHNDNVKELAYQVAVMLQAHKINYNFALPGVYGSTTAPTDSIQNNIRPYGLQRELYGDGNGSSSGLPDPAADGMIASFVPHQDGAIGTANFVGPNQILTEQATADGSSPSYHGGIGQMGASDIS